LTIELSFQNVNPFVRYVGNREINTHRIGRKMAARDNRLFLCSQGSGSMIIGNQHQSITVNDLIFIPAGTPYSFLEDFDSETILLSLNFDFVFNDSLGRFQVGTVNTSSKSLSSITQYIVTDCELLQTFFVCQADDQVKEILHQIQNEYFYQKLYSTELISGYFTIALVRIIRSFSSGSITKANRSLTIDKLIDYIKSNYNRPIKLDDIATYMGYNSDYINRLMRQHTGQTIYQYLLNYRIDKAAQLIRSSELPFSEIAEQTGFLNTSHFSHSFKKRTRKTPSEFRKMD